MGDDVSGSVLIDAYVGKDTVFTFTWDYDVIPLDILLCDPGQICYCSDSTLPADCQPVDVSVDPIYHTITFRFPGIAELGRWQYFITFSQEQITIVATVTSHANDGESDYEPIVVKSGISSTDVSDPTSPLVVYAQVSKGFLPVLGANVTATITDPNSGQWVLKLIDEGAAPDIKANDGVYSKYFISYSLQGRYSVEIKVESNGSATATSTTRRSTANYNYGYIAENGSINLNPIPVQTLNSSSIEQLDAFERSASPVVFEYKGPEVDPTVTDMVPPSKITDLSAIQRNISQLSDGFLVTFHAPGDDLDDGRASLYEMRYTVGTSYNLTNDFENQYLITEENILEGNLSSPKNAGELETFVLRFDNIDFENDTARIGLAVRSRDDNGNVALVSNVCSFPVFVKPPNLNLVEPPATTTAAPTTTEETTAISTTEDPTTTGTLAATTPTPIPIEEVTLLVSFLGQQLNSREAEIALYVLFSVAIFCTLLMLFNVFYNLVGQKRQSTKQFSEKTSYEVTKLSEEGKQNLAFSDKP